MQQPQQQGPLSRELMDRLRDIAVEECHVLDEMEIALESNDPDRVMTLARKLCRLEQAVKEAE
jgi:hypothetical protein